jgi:hypothetical protein
MEEIRKYEYWKNLFGVHGFGDNASFPIEPTETALGTIEELELSIIIDSLLELPWDLQTETAAGFIERADKRAFLTELAESIALNF